MHAEREALLDPDEIPARMRRVLLDGGPCEGDDLVSQLVCPAGPGTGRTRAGRPPAVQCPPPRRTRAGRTRTRRPRRRPCRPRPAPGAPSRTSPARGPGDRGLEPRTLRQSPLQDGVQAPLRLKRLDLRVTCLLGHGSPSEPHWCKYHMPPHRTVSRHQFSITALILGNLEIYTGDIVPLRLLGVIHLHHRIIRLTRLRRSSRQPHHQVRQHDEVSTRNGLRPVARATNTSTDAASVQPRGNECLTPSSSRRTPCSRPSWWPTERNRNSRPDHG